MCLISNDLKRACTILRVKHDFIAFIGVRGRVYIAHTNSHVISRMKVWGEDVGKTRAAGASFSHATRKAVFRFLRAAALAC